MRVVVTGSGGQVGGEVARALAGLADVVALDRGRLDLADPARIAAVVRDLRPAVIVNAAAYTAVDRAEGEEAAAHAVNAAAPGVLAEECRRLGALLVHYSTDYVFDGAKSGAYVETDPVNPLNAYGRTKLEGERRIAASGCDHLVLRTSWVYGPRGGNFLLTMLRLAASRPELRVVADQHGAPTSSLQLAALTRELLAPSGAPVCPSTLARLRAASGVYHATAAGETTWHGFASAIFAARAEMVPGFSPPAVLPIPSTEYPTPARRPANSVLSCDKLRGAFGTGIGPWRDGLREVLSALERA